MSTLKKVLATLLSVILAFSVVSISAFAALPSDAQDSRYAEAIETLGALKIMVGDADTGLFRPEDAILRSEVAKVAVTAMGLADVAEASNYPTKFPDVVENHWANGYINVAANQGLVIGDDVGTFRPDDTITYAEAMTILVRVIGHEPSAISKGGYPSGFLVVGAENGLSRNATAGSEDPANRGLIAQMTFNALTANMMEQTGFGNDPIYTVVDKTLLKDKLKTDKLKGQVVATNHTSLNGTSNLQKDEVQIGDEIYRLAEGVSANNALGYNVVFYSQENNYGEKEVILIRPEEGKNESLSIIADNFESVSDLENKKLITYWKDKEVDRRASEADVDLDAKLIYNGNYEAMDNELINLKDKSGKVDLLDTNRDGKYDLVFVTEYRNVVVDEIMPTTGRIIDKYGAATIVLDPENKDLEYVIEKGAEQIELTDLQEWDVLSVVESKDHTLFRIFVTNNPVEGKVNELDNGRIKIGTTLYKIASNYTQTINLEDEGIFYLDIEGKIAAVDLSSRISSNYAYLINAAINSYADEFFEMRVFTKEGEIKTLRGADKMRLNGQSGRTAEQVLAALKGEDDNVERQLITYDLNSEGKIISIDTAQDLTATGGIDENKFSMNLVFSGAVYKEVTGKLGSVNVSKDTVIFDIPAGTTDIEDYAVRDYTMFEDETPYDAFVFDMGEDFTAKALVVTNANYRANADSPVAIVTSITTTKNDRNEIVDKLYAVQNGEQIAILANEKDMLVKEDANGTKVPLEKGDMIQFKTNTRGAIGTFRILFDASNKAQQFAATPVEDLEILYGQVTAKFPSSMNMTVNGGPTMNIAFGGAKVYHVDTSKETNSVQTATFGDIQKYDSSDPSLVFVKIYKDVVEEIVIIKL